MNIEITKTTETNAPVPLKSEPVFSLNWLGQAGFEIRTPSHHLMIDPYLSDHLAKKYAGREFAHQRMMDTPLHADEVRDLDYLFCTHRHSDHIDPETVPVILHNNPDCIMVAPEAERDYILHLGIPESRILFTNAGKSITASDGLRITVIPSAHEELKMDNSGNMHYLGYIFESNAIRLYHSGDCAPYETHSRMLREYKVDIAMLPINGRDEFRASRGVPGNMDFDEAVELCLTSGIRYLICHHFGMFSFNTADLTEVRERINKLDSSKLQVIIPTPDTTIQITS